MLYTQIFCPKFSSYRSIELKTHRTHENKNRRKKNEFHEAKEIKSEWEKKKCLQQQFVWIKIQFVGPFDGDGERNHEAAAAVAANVRLPVCFTNASTVHVFRLGDDARHRRGLRFWWAVQTNVAEHAMLFVAIIVNTKHTHTHKHAYIAHRAYIRGGKTGVCVARHMFPVRSSHLLHIYNTIHSHTRTYRTCDRALLRSSVNGFCCYTSPAAYNMKKMCVIFVFFLLLWMPSRLLLL